MAESGGISPDLAPEAASENTGTSGQSPLDPTAATFAAEAAKASPELTAEVSTYFRKQSHLVDIQTEHLHEQRAVNLQLLKLKRFDERLRVGLRVFVILVATVIGTVAAVLFHDAVTSRSVVIEPFETPHAIAERGFTGTVVASGVLDKLTRLQAATRTSMRRRNLSNAWSKEIKLTVPETGISFAEISQLLKSRFGDDIHISGDVAQTETGSLEVEVRGDGILPQTFTGTSAQFDKLTTEVAEYVYAQSQPALWATYLVDSGRYQEAIEFCRVSISSASKSDQPVLLTYWAVAIAKTSGAEPRVRAMALVRKAIAAQTDYWFAYDILSTLQGELGDEEGIWRTGQELLKIAGGRPGRAPESTYGEFDESMGDFQRELAGIKSDAEATSGTGTNTFATGTFVAYLEALMHSPVAAKLALDTTEPDPSDPTIVPNTHFARGLLATEAGEAEHAAIEMEAFLSSFAEPAVTYSEYGLNCSVAPVEEAAGRPEKADAVLKTGGTYVDCYRFRGDILDGRGDWIGAQDWYVKSVELAPDLPAGYYSWGLALARHGDIPGAETKLKDANQRGPHWADPLKAWGDVLVKQGKTKEAVAKYDEALKYAPNWKQLKQAREALAEKRG